MENKTKTIYEKLFEIQKQELIEKIEDWFTINPKYRTKEQLINLIKQTNEKSL